MCRTLAYRHSCSHSSLHTVRRCRFTYAAGPNKNPLCSGIRVPSTEIINLHTPCLACEYRTFTETWNQRISAARDRLDVARQSLRELDRKTQCSIVTDYNDDWTCCEDIEFADEPSLAELEWSSSSSNSSSNLSDCSDDFDEPEVECEDTDWFSFSSPNSTDVRSTSAWEAHNMISSGNTAPKRSSRAVALRARLAASEKSALQKLEATRDDFEKERMHLWGGYLKSTARSRADTVRVPQKRNCGPSPLRQVETAVIVDSVKPEPTTAAASVESQVKIDEPVPSRSVRSQDELQRRKTEPSIPSLAQNPYAYPSWIAANSHHADPATKKLRRRHTLLQPEFSQAGILRSCSAEQMWGSTGKPRIWSFEEGDERSSIALPDYGF